MAPIRILQVDAFADRPFSGNPAAVCFLDAGRDDAWMQAVAAEMNLSETAFLVPRDGGYELRWFTPAVEVDLCGHATLASAHALWTTGLLADHEAARFHTRSGLLVCTRHGDLIEMDFPATPVEEIAPTDELRHALGVEPGYVGESKFDKLLVVAAEEELRAIEPDMSSLRKIPARGVIVTSESRNPEFDFVSRYFAPAAGVDEDPVTGSAHCALGPYWSARLGKTEMTAFQASARGGVVRVRVDGDRVVLGGTAVTVFDGVLIA